MSVVETFPECTDYRTFHQTLTEFEEYSRLPNSITIRDSLDRDHQFNTAYLNQISQKHFDEYDIFKIIQRTLPKLQKHSSVNELMEYPDGRGSGNKYCCGRGIDIKDKETDTIIVYYVRIGSEERYNIFDPYDDVNLTYVLLSNLY